MSNEQRAMQWLLAIGHKKEPGSIRQDEPSNTLTNQTTKPKIKTMTLPGMFLYTI
jgi:hypothetical protein